MERKHFYLGGAVLGLLAVLGVSLMVITGSAQTNNCTYTMANINGTGFAGPINVVAGQSGTTTVRVSATGTDCATDTASFQIWDTPNQVIWPSWCTPTTQNLALNNGSSAETVITCTPPATGYLTYDPLLRILRGSTVLTTLTFDLNISAAANVCTGMNLSLSPQSVSNTAGGTPAAVVLTYSCASPAGATAAAVTIQVCPPGAPTATSPCQTVTTQNNVSGGTVYFGTGSYTTTGTYGVRTCINDSTCATGTNMTSFQLTYSSSGTGTITYPPTPTYFVTGGMNCKRLDGTTYAPHSSGFCEPGHEAVCPYDGTRTPNTYNGQTFEYCYRASGAGTGTCTAPQVWCPAVGSSPAGCYTTCPTGTTTGGTMTLTGTIFKDGQYIDPTTGALRSCVSPNAWMKESTTSTGARGFHCMPNYTATATDMPPASCTGTLWAGSSFSSDVCGTTAPSTSTTCTSGQVWCPAAGSSPAGCYMTCPTGTGTGTATACGIGEKCPSGSWCNNGSQCYYPDGQLTCVPWPTPSTGTATAVSMPECPAGTSECSPTDTSCVAIGQIVPYVSGKWCRNGSSYYSTDGKNMTCVKMGGTAPAGFSSCRPDDTNCIPTGSYGPSSGWCSNGMQCYQTANDNNASNDKYCTPMSYGTAAGSVTCPSGYSVCSPTDTNCKQKGDSWTGTSTSYWCSNSEKCNTSTGGVCVGWDEDCPAGTKYCDSNQINSGCLEPGEQREFSSGLTNAAYPYCGGGGMVFYKGTAVSYTATCVKSPTTWDPNWVPTVPAGFQFCRPSDTYCIEPGTTGPSTGWCAWMTPGTGGYMGGAGTSASTTRTCPAVPGYTPPGGVTPLPPTVCPAGERLCKNLSGSGSFCTSAPTCPDKPVICPITTMMIMPCFPGQIEKKITTADGCTNFYCEDDRSLTQTTCKEGEGYFAGPVYAVGTATSGVAPSSMSPPQCKMPYFCWENGAWTQKPEPNYYSNTATASGTMSGNACSTFRVEELEYRTLWAKKWDPAKFGAWYWPNYPANTPTYRYDSVKDALVSCSQKDFYAPVNGFAKEEYYSPCQQMPEEDKPLWLARFRAEKKMFEYWNQNTRRREPEPPICPQVISYARDLSGKCKSFPTPCDVPKGWAPVPSCEFIPPICPTVIAICGPGEEPEIGFNGCDTGRCVPKGKAGDACRIGLRGYYDEVRGHRFFLRDVAQQIKESPESLRASLEDLKQIVAKGEKLATEAENLIKQTVKGGKCDVAARKDIEDKLQILREDILPKLHDQQGSLRISKECRFFNQGIDERVRGLKYDASRFERQGDKDFAAQLREYAAQMENMQPKAKAVCEAADTRSLDDLRFEFRIIEESIGDLFRDRHDFVTDNYRDNFAGGILSGIDFLRRAIDQQGLKNQCQEVIGYLDTVTQLLNEEKFTEAESFRDIVFDAAKQCGAKFDFEGGMDVDRRVFFEGIAGLDEKTIDRLVDRVLEKVSARVEVLLDQKIAELVANAQLLQEKALQQLVTSVDNVQQVLKEKNKELMDEVLGAKQNILVEVNAALKALRSSTKKVALSSAQRAAMEKAIETAAVGVWCGDYSEQVAQKLSLAKQALDAGSLTVEDVTSLDAFMREAQSGNPEACFESGVSAFKDTPPEQWFFRYFHGPEAVFRGKFSAQGRPLGIVEPGLQTRWMEGGMVVARALGIDVDGRCNVPAAIPGATNVPYGACALDYFIDNDVPLPTHPVHEYMTRAELAMLIVSLVSDRLPIQGTEEHVKDYGDVKFDSPYGQAIATMIANKIMLGKDPTGGKFIPTSIPSRAELATSIGRLLELLQFTSGSTGSANEPG